jgi:hypothetical protein
MSDSNRFPGTLSKRDKKLAKRGKKPAKRNKEKRVA